LIRAEKKIQRRGSKKGVQKKSTVKPRKPQTRDCWKKVTKSNPRSKGGTSQKKKTKNQYIAPLQKKTKKNPRQRKDQSKKKREKKRLIVKSQRLYYIGPTLDALSMHTISDLKNTHVKWRPLQTAHPTTRQTRHPSL